MEQSLLVPVRASAGGTLALPTGRLPSGERVGLAFTCESRLAAALGPSQWVYLAGEALAGLLAPLGVEHYRVDPGRAEAPRPKPAPARLAPGRPRAGEAAIHFCPGGGLGTVRPLARRVA